MSNQEVYVCYFVEILNATQPLISRHLAYVRKTGLVEARRDGKWMHYRIAVLKDLSVRQLLRNTLRWLANDKGMQRDRERLATACCAPQKFEFAGSTSPTVINEPRKGTHKRRSR